jgi:hypothetical protein
MHQHQRQRMMMVLIDGADVLVFLFLGPREKEEIAGVVGAGGDVGDNWLGGACPGTDSSATLAMTSVMCTVRGMPCLLCRLIIIFNQCHDGLL